MKKHILTGSFVAACVGLLYFTAFYNKSSNGEVASKHQTKADFKNFIPTAKNSQYDLFSRLVKNQPDAVVDNTYVADITVPLQQTSDNTSPAIAGNGIFEPFSIAKVEFTEYQLAAAQAQVIRNAKTGTIINIQPNSFINEFGELAEGTVKVFMREMHTAPEYFMRGLPMNGYQSAGVIELKATTEDGQSLFLNNEKPIDVLMASANPTDNYAVYSVNESTRSWQLRNAHITHLKQAAQKKKVNEYDTNISLAAVRKGVHVFKHELRFKTQLNYRAYPEMEVFNNVEWVYTGKHAKKVRQNLLKDRSNPYGSRRGSGLLFNYWTDVKLTREDNGQYHMIFTNGPEVLNIPVKPEHIYGQSINPESLFNDYQAAYKVAKPENGAAQAMVEEVETFDPTSLPAGYTAVTRFSVSELGIWGLNQKIAYDQNTAFNISFTDEKGNCLSPTVFYQYNSALNTYQILKAEQLLSVNYNKGYNILFTITGSNEVALLDNKSFGEMVAKSKEGYPLSAKLNRRMVQSKSDVVALFNS